MIVRERSVVLHFQFSQKKNTRLVSIVESIANSDSVKNPTLTLCHSR